MTSPANQAAAVPSDCSGCPAGETGICLAAANDNPERGALLRSDRRVLDAGSRLYHEGESSDEVFVVRDGWAMLYRDFGPGERVILDFGLPGALLGYQPDHHNEMLHSATCLTKVSVCVFARGIIRSLARTNPRVAERLAAWSWRESVVAQNHLTNLACRESKPRIAHLLFELCSRLGCEAAALSREGCALPLTQGHIADALSLNPAHVCRQLRQLKHEGVLEYRHRRLRIFDHHALTRLVSRRDGLYLTCGPGAIAVCSAKDLPPAMD